jgi:elongation factor 3
MLTTRDEAFNGKDKQMMIDTLASVGFDAEKRAMSVGALSGGWKMKLELARAMLMDADILLLDEPTNHLDVSNVAWLTKYLNSLKNVTSIIVSHDSGFIDDVCSHIIHYEQRKLKTYKGNLSEFVKVHPEAKSYYSLAATVTSFKLPDPGFLEGVKSKDRAILKMTGVGFQYPGTNKLVRYLFSSLSFDLSPFKYLYIYLIDCLWCFCPVLSELSYWCPGPQWSR